MLKYALLYAELGYAVFPVAQGQKVPAFAESWKDLATLDKRQIRRWFQKPFNIGVPTDGYAVLDVDDLTRARELWVDFTGRRIVTASIKTRRGIHFLFSGDLRNARCNGYDIRGAGGYVLGAGSIIQGFEYLFLTPLVEKDKLAPFPADFLPTTTSTGVSHSIKDARRYIGKIFAVAGQGGHNATFRAACKLRDAGLSEAEVLAALIEWQETNCDPKWTLRELTHKAKSCFQKGTTNGTRIRISDQTGG